MDLPPTGHDPVLLAEVLDLLRPAAGQTFVDCTLGRAGHAWAIADRLGPTGTLVGLDVDPKNLAAAKGRLEGVACTTRLFHANFAELDEALDAAGIEQVDGILADLGVSTNQLFDEAYGLSFAAPMPLDMRLDPRLDSTAADFVNSLPEKDLADVLYVNAQERKSRRIARRIGEARRRGPIRTTAELAEIVRAALPRPKRGETIDPATRTFMALRMEVNAELTRLDKLLEMAPRRLRPGGRLGMISFHSGEDGRVKRALRAADSAGLVRIVTKKPVGPGEAEVFGNPRSRSAKLRVAERL